MRLTLAVLLVVFEIPYNGLVTLIGNLLCLLPQPCFFLPLLENGFAIFYLLLNPFGILVELVWKNGDGVDIPRNLFSLFIGEIRGRIDFIKLFSPVGFTIEMNDGYDDDYCD